MQVSIDSSMSPEKNWEVGKAVSKLRLVARGYCWIGNILMRVSGGDRDEGILVLSGGLTAHNLRDRRSFSPTTASENHKAFDAAMHSAIKIDDVSNWLIVWLRSWTAN